MALLPRKEVKNVLDVFRFGKSGDVCGNTWAILSVVRHAQTCACSSPACHCYDGDSPDVSPIQG